MGQGVRSAPGRESAAPGVQSSTDPELPLLDKRFGRDAIAVLRHEVSARLSEAGLTGDRLQALRSALVEHV